MGSGAPWLGQIPGTAAAYLDGMRLDESNALSPNLWPGNSPPVGQADGPSLEISQPQTQFYCRTRSVIPDDYWGMGPDSGQGTPRGPTIDP